MISRRRFTQAFAAGLAATSLAACSSTAPVTPAAAVPPPAVPPPGAGLRAGSGEHTSLGPIKHADAGDVTMAYAESGPAGGPPVLLLHGWPYDPYSYADVAPQLAAAGFRVIVPFLRGYGPTVFKSAGTVRNGQQTAVALDVVALMDTLKIGKAILGGYDWGSRTAAVIAALWPQRCQAVVPVSGYIVTDLKANQQPLAPAAELGWWYQYYFATERGRAGYAANRHDFNKLIWKTASPAWNFDDATYDRSAAAFENPDHVAIVIHNYRWRLSLAPGEPQYEAYERKLAAGATIGVPAITLSSDFDGAAKDGKAYRARFTGKYEHRVLDGIGHNVPQEAPRPFAQAIMDVAKL